MKATRNSVLMLSDLQSGTTQLVYVTDHDAPELEAEIDRLRGLLREWRQVADDAKDLTFVPVARKTDAALAGTADQPPAVRGPYKCAYCAVALDRVQDADGRWWHEDVTGWKEECTTDNQSLSD